ncbi:hypothetical protein [Planctomonas deserti]|uniref:hypothetical protein n=1 Tax=Planctomonas deserti TaxID=2144185 RepID=UPI000D35FED0|nr:hypothetical protein [Planctomonas deserti]
MNAEDRRHRRSALIWTVAIAAGLSGLAFFAGVTLTLSLLLAVTIVAVGTVLALLAAPHDERWPEARVALRSGARREVARLSWSMADDDGTVSDAAVQRLRTLATVRLAERGIDLADPADRSAADSALGATAFRLLTEPGRHRPEALLRCAAAIERLDRSHSASPLSASPHSAPRRTA